jgi:hypothetical protein
MGRIDEAKEVLQGLRKCRSRLNRLHLDHAAAYADIAVQLLKQSIGSMEGQTEEI